MLQMDGCKIVLEATLPDRRDHKGGKDKRVEMKEYIEQTNADLGVLVMAGIYSSLTSQSPAISGSWS